LKENPFVGVRNERFADVRELKVPRIPFTVVYRAKQDRIEVLRVLDEQPNNPFK
jgi:hypothetical protein